MGSSPCHDDDADDDDDDDADDDDDDDEDASTPPPLHNGRHIHFAGTYRRFSSTKVALASSASASAAAVFTRRVLQRARCEV
jgi:hypothetical protein